MHFNVRKYLKVYRCLVILLTYEKHVHDRIISLRGEVWAHRTDLTPPLCIVLRRGSERSHILVLGESIMPLTTIVCVIFLFSFHSFLCFAL